jgi:hypothetical protein
MRPGGAAALDAGPDVPTCPGPGDGPPPPASRLPGWVVATAVLAGAALRLVVLTGPLGRPDADEAITGLMARHVLAGDGFPLFFWGQRYGGTIELVPVTLATAVLGSSLFSLRLSTVVLAAVNAALLWRVAARLLPPLGAQVAGLLLWLGPPTAVWFGVRQMLFYQPTVTLGLILGLLALRARQPSAAAGGRRGGRPGYRPLRWLAAAAVAAVGLWTSPDIVYFVLPAAAVAAGPAAERVRWPSTRVLAAAGAAAFVTVWLGTDLLWRRVLPERGSFPVLGSYVTRLAWFAGVGLPAVLGFAETFTHRWIAGPVGVAAYLAALTVLARGWRAGARARPWAWDAAGMAAFPFVFALLPFGPDQPNLRYLFFVVPFVAVTLARALPDVRAAAVALALTLAVSAIGLARLTIVSEDGPPAAPTRVGDVGDVGPAIAALDRQGVGGVFADYWVAYRIAFESGERVVASPSWGLDRDAAATARVRAAGRPAWVVSAGDQAAALQADLAAAGVSAAVERAGELVVVIPDRAVRPEDVSDRARHA